MRLDNYVRLCYINLFDYGSALCSFGSIDSFGWRIPWAVFLLSFRSLLRFFLPAASRGDTSTVGLRPTGITSGMPGEQECSLVANHRSCRTRWSSACRQNTGDTRFKQRVNRGGTPATGGLTHRAERLPTLSRNRFTPITLLGSFA